MADDLEDMFQLLGRSRQAQAQQAIAQQLGSYSPGGIAPWERAYRAYDPEDREYNGNPGSVKPSEIIKDCMKLEGSQIGERVKMFLK